MVMPRSLSVSLAGLLALVVAASPVGAQIKVPPVGGGEPTAQPTPSPTPTKRLPDPDPEPTPTKTTKPPSSSGSGGSGGSGSSGSGSSGTKTGTGRSGGSAPTTGSPAAPRRVVGPKTNTGTSRGVGDWATREKTPAHTTTRLLELIDAAQPDGDEASLRELSHGFGRFPVVGYVWYQDDYGAPRWFPTYHPHIGTDLFAKSGTPVIACVDGSIMKWASGGGGGNALWLLGDDGVRYYYGHLRSFAPGINVLGRRVKMGDVIGTVGATGKSAAGTYPHVHFEINPGGLGTVNPKPILDSWLRNAEERAAVAAGLLSAPESFNPARPGRWVSRFDLSRAAQPAGTTPLWTSALGGSPTATFAELALTELMARDDLSVTSRGADGAQPFDALALLLGEGAPEDEHAHAD